MSLVSTKSFLPFVKALLFGIIYAGVYILLLHIPIPVQDTLGVIRVIIVGILAKFVEHGIYWVVKKEG